MGINANEIITYKVSTPPATNLTINLVNGFGNCGGQRDNKKQREKGLTEASLPKRLINAVQAIPREKKTALIDFQGQLNNYKDIEGIDYFGYWWVHNRGTNELQDYDVIIGIGNPTANLGAKAAEFQTLSGKYAHPTKPTTEFENYTQNSIDSEKLQLVGRLRVHLQPHKQKEIYLLGDYSQNLENQLKEKFPGSQVKKMMSYDLCPSAATRKDLDIKRAIEYGLKLYQTGQKITQEKIAKGIHCTQSWISKIFSKLGSYDRIIELFQSLNKLFLRKWNNPEDIMNSMSEDVRWCVKHFFPLEVDELLKGNAKLNELMDTLNLGKKFYKINILNYISIDVIFGFILGIIAHLPEEYQKIFEEVILEPPEPVPI